MTTTRPPRIQKRRWRGIAAAPGIALGPAFVYRVSPAEPRLRVLPDDRAARREFQRFQASLHAVRRDLQRLKRNAGQTVSSAIGKIFDAQILIVDDAAIIAEVKDRILADRIAAENAFSEVVTRAQRTIGRASDPYLREMANDIDAVKTRVINHLLGIAETLNKPLTRPVIVLAASITPSDIVSLRREFVLGIVSETGGQTSHTALLAKSLNIPAVVGVDVDVRTVRPGAQVVVDGFSGVFLLEPDEDTIRFFERKKGRIRSPWPKKLDALRSQPAVTRDRHRVALMANIDLAGEVPGVLHVGADGIGLYRTEYLFLQRGTYPSEQAQFKVYREAVEALQGRPLVVRTFDLGSDKTLTDPPVESNPALGLRGVRLSLEHPGSLKTQFRALLAASAYGPVWVMIPMVSACEELALVKKHWLTARASLRKRGIRFDRRMPLGIMVETPAAVHLLPDLARDVDFFSIGTNDLLQYTLAADRGNRMVSEPEDKWHPALWRQIAAVSRAAHKAKRHVGICGELASEIGAVPFLVGLGLNSLSCHPNTIPRIKALIRSLRYADARKSAADLLTKSRTADVLRLVRRVGKSHHISA